MQQDDEGKRNAQRVLEWMKANADRHPSVTEAGLALGLTLPEVMDALRSLGALGPGMDSAEEIRALTIELTMAELADVVRYFDPGLGNPAADLLALVQVARDTAVTPMARLHAAAAAGAWLACTAETGQRIVAALTAAKLPALPRASGRITLRTTAARMIDHPDGAGDQVACGMNVLVEGVSRPTMLFLIRLKD